MTGAAILLGGTRPIPAFGAEGTVGTSPGYPSGITAGQVLVCDYAAKDATAPAITVPAGWTEIGSGASLGGAFFLCRSFWKVADGTESGSLAVTATGTVYREGVIRRYTGTSLEAGAITATATSATNMDCVNVTTLAQNRLAVQHFNWPGAATIGNITGETGTDYTEAKAEVAGTNRRWGVQTGSVPSSTAITGGSATLSVSSDTRTRVGFAIVP